MTTTGQRTDFFRVGGTLHLDSPSYIRRPADDELFEQVRAGQFCYVLTPRQMGKSSLMLRTAERLRQAGARPAMVDLSSLGTQEITSEQWYLGLIKRLGLELKLSVESELWWHVHSSLTPVQRFTDFLHDAVLAEIPTQVVIFVDEIDSTLKLPFTDDFFAAVRFIYNRRATQPEYDRLTFVLLGVAAPTDLIQDSSRTPFNIGHAIDLREFSRQDTQPLQVGLEQAYPNQGQGLLDRIFYWTNGHPYLTQKLCLKVAETGGDTWTEQEVDALVEKLFLTEDAKKEDNLQFVRGNVEANPERRPLLQLYRRVYEGRAVKEDERSPLQNRLKLFGLVRVENRTLQVRNEIYRRVFNQAWIKENTPIPWTQWVTVGAVIVSILAIIFTVIFLRWQEQQALDTKVKTFTEGFRGSTDPDIRLNALAGLCQLDKKVEAQNLFFELDHGQQLDIFRKVKAEAASQKLETAVNCLDPAVAERISDTEYRDNLSTEMCCALYRWQDGAGERFSQQLGHPCECEAESEGSYEQPQ